MIHKLIKCVLEFGDDFSPDFIQNRVHKHFFYFYLFSNISRSRKRTVSTLLVSAH